MLWPSWFTAEPRTTANTGTREVSERLRFDEAALAASVATALGSAQRLADALGHGTPQAFDINGDQGSIQILPMGGPWLAIAIDRGVNVALLHLEARPVVERIAAALKL